MMENYNEKVNYGSQEFPKFVDRLTISNGLYGYNLFDRKERKNLLFCKSKEICEEGMTLLKTSEYHFFESFKERINDDMVIIPNKILIDTNKYGQDYYSIPTINDLYKVSLHILNCRFENNFFCKSNIPEKLDYTYDDIEKMPESFRKDAKSKLDVRNKYIKECEEVNKEFELIEKALNEKNGQLAWHILKNRQDYEYEKIEIIETIKL